MKKIPLKREPAFPTPTEHRRAIVDLTLSRLIGEKVRHLRTEILRWTPKEAADVLDIAAITLWRIENGKSCPSVIELVRLLAAAQHPPHVMLKSIFEAYQFFCISGISDDEVLNYQEGDIPQFYFDTLGEENIRIAAELEKAL